VDRHRENFGNHAAITSPGCLGSLTTHTWCRSHFSRLVLASCSGRLMRNLSKLGLVHFAVFIPTFSFSAETAPCQHVKYEQRAYTVCEVDLRRQSVRLFWKKPDGTVYGYPSSLPRILGSSGRLLFATNGGMYHEDSSPVGLYVEQGRELVRANTNAG